LRIEQVYAFGMVEAQLREMNQLLDSLHAVDRSELDGLDTVAVIYRLKNRVDALAATASSAYDDAESWRATGAKSAAAAIATGCSQPLGLTRAMVRHGKKLKSMSYVAEAYANGDI